MGPILAIGGVDILIPPSGLAVLLGSLAGISISGLLVGGIVPGLILSRARSSAMCMLRCWIDPSLAPAYDDGQAAPVARPWLNLAVTVLPLIGVFAIVVVSMTGGWATPTESSALGAVATVLLALIYGSLTLAKSLEVASRHAVDFRLAPVHHRRRDHLRPVAQLFRRHRRPCRSDRRLAVRPDDDPDRHARSPADSRLLHRPDQHHDDHAAVLHADPSQHGRRPDLVRHHCICFACRSAC